MSHNSRKCSSLYRHEKSVLLARQRVRLLLLLATSLRFHLFLGRTWEHLRLRKPVSETGDVKSAEVMTVIGFPSLMNGLNFHCRAAATAALARTGSPIKTKEAKYPAKAREKGIQGQVIVVAAKSGQTLLLIHSVLPEYPREAYKAHVKGKVVLHAIIDKDGRVTNLTAVTGPEILLPAALAAVQQWRYRPYMVNGEPVEVDTDITLDFPLTQ